MQLMMKGITNMNKWKLLMYLVVGAIVAFIVFAVILSILGDQSDVVEENEKLKEQRQKILNLLNMWDGNINSIFEQQLLDILKGDEDNASKDEV